MRAPASPTDRADPVRRRQTWNFAMHSLDGILYFIGMCFADVSTIMPAFIATLTDSAMLIGLIPAVNTLGWLLPQLATAYATSGIRDKKRAVLIIGLFQRIPWFLIALSTFLWAGGHPTWAVTLFFVLFAVATLSGGFVTPLWFDFVARTVPVRRRGRLLAIRMAVGGLAGFALGAVVRAILGGLAFPNNYALLFLCYGAFTALSWFFVALVRDVDAGADAAPPARKSPSDYLRTLAGALRNNPMYARFVAGVMLSSLSLISFAFLTKHGIQNLGATTQDVAGFMVTLVVSTSVASLAIGYIGDHLGNAVALRFSTAAGVVSSVIVLTTRAIPALHTAFMLQGVFISGRIISSNNMVIEFCRPEERPMYLGLTNTLVALMAGTGPLLFGWILEHTAMPYSGAFATAAAGGALGWLVLMTVRDPRHTACAQPAPPGEVC